MDGLLARGRIPAIMMIPNTGINKNCHTTTSRNDTGETTHGKNSKLDDVRLFLAMKARVRMSATITAVPNLQIP